MRVGRLFALLRMDIFLLNTGMAESARGVRAGALKILQNFIAMENFMILEFLKKAQENLIAAQFCFERECYNACANRIYYAALQAAVAAIAAEGIKQDKVDHKQVQSDFNGQLIYRRKRYPAKFRTYLLDMQVLRNQADYTTEPVSRKVAERWLARAVEFVTHIVKELKEYEL